MKPHRAWVTMLDNLKPDTSMTTTAARAVLAAHVPEPAPRTPRPPPQ
jgi:hypothetical protein